MRADDIRIENARAHNLAGVSCRIPVGRLTVVSGVSGSGKSSLAFDTLYAEGQRRYVASLSTYARQFLERLPRPDVDAISNLPPAIAIEQRNRVTNARSTVGTATEILDHLRLLFARVGETRCCGKPVRPGTVEGVTARLLERHAGARLVLSVPLPRRRGETQRELRDRLARDGYTRLLRPDGSVCDVTELTQAELRKLASGAELVIDRLAVGADARARIAEAVAAAFTREGEVRTLVDGERRAYREGFACDDCGRRHPTPEPALFSFNSPLGACEACHGFGRTQALDLERVIPDPLLSLAAGAIAPFQTPSGRECQRDLLRAAKAAGLPTGAPWRQLDEAQRAFVMDGDDGDWYGVRGYFEYLESRRYKVQARVTIARYRRFDPCEACGGTRLRPEALCVFVGGRTLGELARLSIGELDAWLAALELAPAQTARGERLLAGLRARVGTAREVGLGYLSLERQVRTLSGGEAQRIQLATALGGALTGALYVLDEPSVGLHARDVARLLRVLHAIRDQGNTVVVVEHAAEIVAAADHVIDLGPGAGRDGGRVVAEGSVAAVAANPASLTGRMLAGDFRVERVRRTRARGRLAIRGAAAHNLKGVDVEIPLGQLVVVSGVSGAGKSSLVRSVLVGNLRREPERGACAALEGADQIDEVVVVEPTPPGRSQRSNPATVSKAFDGIRRGLAATPEARRQQLTPGWFSFNVPGGRCESCEGTGEAVVDMQFLEDVRVPCEACGGRRYRKEADAFRLHGRSVTELLDLTIDEARALFASEPSVAERLAPFVRVGLGYLTLAQPLSTLSGGELQRMRVALALAEKPGRALYVLDEPTTGLHAAEVQVLLDCLEQLLAAGGSVIVVEHNLDVIRLADHVIEVGPEGGPGGGRIVAQGTPEAVARVEASHTGRALRALAGARPARATG
jgi:excinuclease ABC subunit A